MFFMCLSGSFSHSNFFCHRPTTGFKKQALFLQRGYPWLLYDLKNDCRSSGWDLALPLATSTQCWGFWSQPRPCLDPQHSLPVPNPALWTGADFQVGAGSKVGFWGCSIPSQVHGVPPEAQTLLGCQVPAAHVLGAYFIPNSIYVSFICLCLKLWLI